MVKPTLSVIMPTYNTNKEHLDDAIDSVLNQTIGQNLELIIIDDSTNNDVYNIAHSLSMVDKRVKYFKNPENIGPGRSRNLGLSKALGEYITFIDHDDFNEPEMYEMLINKIEQDKTDVCFSYGYRYFDEDDSLKNMKFPKFFSAIKSLKDLRIRRKLYFSFVAPWAKIYKASFIKKNKLEFAKKSKFDDLMFHFLLLQTCDKVSFYKKPMYYHREFAQSLTGRQSKDKFFMAKDLLITMKEALIASKNLGIDSQVVYAYFFKKLFKYIKKLKKNPEALAYIAQELTEFSLDKNAFKQLKELSLYKKITSFIKKQEKIKEKV